MLAVSGPLIPNEFRCGDKSITPIDVSDWGWASLPGSRTLRGSGRFSFIGPIGCAPFGSSDRFSAGGSTDGDGRLASTAFPVPVARRSRQHGTRLPSDSGHPSMRAVSACDVLLVRFLIPDTSIHRDDERHGAGGDTVSGASPDFGRYFNGP